MPPVDMWIGGHLYHTDVGAVLHAGHAMISGILISSGERPEWWELSCIILPTPRSALYSRMSAPAEITIRSPRRLLGFG